MSGSIVMGAGIGAMHYMMGAAIPVMHCTGMAAASFTVSDQAPDLSHSVA